MQSSVTQKDALKSNQSRKRMHWCQQHLVLTQGEKNGHISQGMMYSALPGAVHRAGHQRVVGIDGVAGSVTSDASLTCLKREDAVVRETFHQPGDGSSERPFISQGLIYVAGTLYYCRERISMVVIVECVALPVQQFHQRLQAPCKGVEESCRSSLVRYRGVWHTT